MSTQTQRPRSSTADRLSWLERVGRIEARRGSVDLDALRHRRDAERAARADADQGSYAEAARSALRFWQSARTVRTVHPYLSRKRIQPHAARRRGKALFLPIVDLDGGMHSLQVITPAGQQTLLADGRIAGNLRAVAVEARCKWPDAEIIVCCDRDDVGVGYGRAAALAAGARCAVPEFPDGAEGTNYNDLACWLAEQREVMA
jgi:putative DNA primase/helicase